MSYRIPANHEPRVSAPNTTMSTHFDAGQFDDLAPHYDELMRVVPYDDWAEYIYTLWTFAGHEPKRVLDCACGTGNVSLELAKRGLDVTGVDIAAGMIEVAQQKMVHEEQGLASNLRFYCEDLTTFDLGETFDSITCLYDSLNYIIEPAALQKAFARIAAHTEPNGVFVFDMNSDWAFKADLFTQYDRSPARDLHYDWKANYDPETHICTVAMEFQRRNETGQIETFYETHRERAYELDEVKQMLIDTGWLLEFAFDAYSLNPPHDQSERWYFVARKPE
jgi:SAM-dependent methyltransferase